MTGQIGKPGCGPFSSPVSRMQWEDGSRRHVQPLPGYRHVQNPQDRDVVEQFWKLKPGQISSNWGRLPGISSLGENGK